MRRILITFFLGFISAVLFGQSIDGALKTLTTAGSANTYTITEPLPAAYTNKERYIIEFHVGNTGASTLNRAGLGAKSIKKNVTDDLVSGDIVTGARMILSYNGTNFIIEGKFGGGGNPAWLLASGGTLTGANTIDHNGFNITFSGTGTTSFPPSATKTGLNVGSAGSDPSLAGSGDLYFQSGNAFRFNNNGNWASFGPAPSAVSSFFFGDAIGGLATNSLAFGYNTTANGVNSVSIGANAGTSSGTLGIGAISIGKDANYSKASVGIDGIAIGEFTNSGGTNSIAIGAVATSGGQQEISIGYRAGDQATHADNAISLGYHANWGGFGALTIGNESTAVGNNVAATGAGSVAMGRGTLGSSLMINSTDNSFGLGWTSTTPDILLAKTAVSYVNSTAGFVIGSNSITSGDVLLDLQSSSKALLLTRGTSNPASPVNGMLYYNSSANEMRARINDAWVVLGASPGAWLLASGGTLTGNNNVTGAFNIDFAPNRFQVTQNAQSGTVSPAIKSTSGTHTAITASAEQLGSFMNIAAATHQWSTGALTTQRFNYFGAPTAAFVGASTLTNAYTSYIEVPVAGTNATLTNSWSLGVAGGIQIGPINATTFIAPTTGTSAVDNTGTNLLLSAAGGNGQNKDAFTFVSGQLNSTSSGAQSILRIGSTTQMGVSSGANNNYAVRIGSLLFNQSGTATGENAMLYLQARWQTTRGDAYGVLYENTTNDWGAGTSTGRFIAFSNENTINQTGNTTDVISFNSAPTYTLSAGATIGFYHNPAVTSITGTHYAFRSSSGKFASGTGTVTNTHHALTNQSNATNIAEFRNNSDNTKVTITNAGSTTIAQSALSSGWAPTFTATPGAHTSMTASTEFVDNDFTGSNHTWAAGTIATQRFTYFRQNTVTTGTATNAYTVYMDAPTGSITNAYALGVNGNLNSLGKLFTTTTTTLAAVNVGSFAGDPSSPTNGDISYNSTSNLFRFRQNGAWVSIGVGTGDVVGPGSSTDNALARFDGTTGKLLQNSDLILNDVASNNVVVKSSSTNNLSIVPADNMSMLLAGGSGNGSPSGNVYIRGGLQVASEAKGNISMLYTGNPFSSAINFQSGEQIIHFSDVVTAPTGNPSGGAFFWVDPTTHTPKWRVPSGTIYDLSDGGAGGSGLTYQQTLAVVTLN